MRNIIILSLLLAAGAPLEAQKAIRIDLGTVAPKGSVWHQILEETAQEWRKLSASGVGMRIFSGVTGDEVEMIRKVRVGSLQAVALSGAGLSHIEPGVGCLQIPMMIESNEEFDFVRNHLTSRLEQMIEQKGFQVVNWAEVGWIHFFTKKPARTLDDIRKMKLFTAAGDPEAEKLYKEFDLTVVPLAVTDLHTSLQTGLIDAFHVPPLFALADQSFALTKHMIPVKFAPLVGATVISRRAWQQVPQELRPKMLEAARAAAGRRRDEIRQMADVAVVEMRKRGLTVVPLDAATRNNWLSEAEAAYPKIRGRLVPADLFDEVERLRKEFRSKKDVS